MALTTESRKPAKRLQLGKGKKMIGELIPMKGNIYLYAMLIPLLAIITIFLVNFTAGIVPGQSEGRNGNVISISQYSFGFSPDNIELKQGESVTLRVKSAGGNHVFAIDHFNISVPVKSGQEISVPLVADIAGEFIYYDPTPGHNDSGEHGLLAVRP